MVGNKHYISPRKKTAYITFPRCTVHIYKVAVVLNSTWCYSKPSTTLSSPGNRTLLLNIYINPSHGDLEQVRSESAHLLRRNGDKMHFVQALILKLKGAMNTHGYITTKSTAQCMISYIRLDWNFPEAKWTINTWREGHKWAIWAIYNCGVGQ